MRYQVKCKEAIALMKFFDIFRMVLVFLLLTPFHFVSNVFSIL